MSEDVFTILAWLKQAWVIVIYFTLRIFRAYFERMPTKKYRILQLLQIQCRRFSSWTGPRTQKAIIYISQLKQF